MQNTHPYMKFRRGKKTQWHTYTRMKRLLASLKRWACFQIATGQLVPLNITLTSWNLPLTKCPVTNSKLRFNYLRYLWNTWNFITMGHWTALTFWPPSCLWDTYLVSWPTSHPCVLESLRLKVLVSLRSRSLCVKGFLPNITMPGGNLTSQGWDRFGKDTLVCSCKEIETMR